MKYLLLLLVVLMATTSIAVRRGNLGRDFAKETRDAQEAGYRRYIQNCLLQDPTKLDFYCHMVYQIDGAPHPFWFTGNRTEYFVNQTSAIWNALLTFYHHCWSQLANPLDCQSDELQYYEGQIIGYSGLVKDLMRKRMLDWIEAIDEETELVNHCFHHHKQIAAGVHPKAVLQCQGISWKFDALKIHQPARESAIRQKWSKWIAYWSNRTAVLNATGKSDEASLLNCQYNSHWKDGSDVVDFQKMLKENDECSLLNYPQAITSRISSENRTAFHKKILRLAPVFALRIKVDHLHDCLKSHRLGLYGTDPICQDLTWRLDHATNEPVPLPLKKSWKPFLRYAERKAQQRSAAISATNRRFFPLIDFAIKLQIRCAQEIGPSIEVVTNYSYNCDYIGRDFPAFDVLLGYYETMLVKS